MQKTIIYTDGGARGNPGIAGAGAVIKSENGEVIAEISKYLGENVTNNYAEYEAIILVLQKCRELGLQNSEIEIRADSKLAIEQLSGNWKVKDPGVKAQFLRVQDELKHFKSVAFTHIRRTLNKHADKLANDAMDKAK